MRAKAMKLKITFVLAVALALAAPVAAAAHVTLQPEEAEAGAYTVFDVHVPNESADKVTTRVEVKFPPGFFFASYRPVAGWTVEVKMAKRDNPLTARNEKVNPQVARVTWTADDAGAAVQPGQFVDFPVSMQVPPGGAGDTLTFRALQTYEGDEVARWVGAPDSDRPAPQVAVTAGGENQGAGSHAAAAGSEPSEEASDDSDSASKGLGIAALVIAILALLIGLVALKQDRRTAP
ncbi:MAG TPA: YcnI family protein [Solirubrobacterales bacterium]|nr:YcnI family protein [Solirubrobacterales bacterium]